MAIEIPLDLSFRTPAVKSASAHSRNPPGTKSQSSASSSSPSRPLKRNKRPVPIYDPSDPDCTIPLAVADFSIVVDTREQLAYRFSSILDPITSREIIVPLEHRKLESGDYSIDGFEDLVTCERKSLADFLGSITSDRERFEREFHRMNEMIVAFLIIESSREEAIDPTNIGQISPQSIIETERSWKIRFPSVHWIWCEGGRNHAELETYKNLAMFWRIHKHESSVK